MEGGAYSHHNVSKTSKPTKNVFSFGLSSRPADRYPQHGTNSQPSFVLSRAMKSSHQRPSFDQNRNEQHHSPRIFHPSTHFQTPQRTAAKQEPVSPLGPADDYQVITPSSNTKSTEQFNRTKYQSQYEVKEVQQYLPTPSENPGFISRAASLTPSNRSGSHNPEADDDELDLSDLMNRRMKEAKIVKSQLAEERVLTANLKSQVASAQSENSELKKRILNLESASNAHNRDIAMKEEELLQIRELLAEAERAQQSQQALLDEKEKELAGGLENTNLLQRRLQESEERIAKVKETAKRGIENLGRNCQAMQATLEQLKHKHDHSHKNLQLVKDELVDLKLTATDQFKQIEPLLDPSGRRLLKSVETQNLVQELQNDRSDAQRVIDLLRDKLHVLGAQVVEYKEKVEILENLRKEESANLTRTASLLENASDRINHLTEKLVKRQAEDVALAAEGAKLEVQVADSEEQIERLQGELKAKAKETENFLEQNRKLSLDVQLTTARLQDAVQRQTTESERLETAQARTRSQEQEITLLRSKLETSEKTEESLKANVAKATSKVQELEGLIRTANTGEAVAISKCEHVSEKMKTLESESRKTRKDLEERLKGSDLKVERLGMELREREAELHQSTSRLAVLQDRFDSQATMLKLAKEHSGDLQERLLASEKENAANLEANEGKHRTEVAVLTERRSALQAQVDQLQAKLERLLASEKENLAKLETVEGKRQAEVAVLTEQRSALQAQVDQLQAKLVSLDTSLEITRTNLGNAKADYSILGEQKNNLQVTLDRLRDDYAKADALRADIKTEKRTLQEALNRSLDETSKLRNLVEEHRNQETDMDQQKAMNALRDALEQLKGHEKAHDDALARTSADFQDGLERIGSKLLETESKRAEVAEKSFERASTQVQDLKTELSKLGTELQTTKDRAATVQEELTRAQGVEAQMKATLVKIETLEAENQELRRMEGTVQERYSEGQLNDSEKELVNLIMKTTQTMHEQDMVEKENDLRRRDNMISTLQAKIDALESTLAKCLKNQGQAHEQEGQSKSMVDLNIWMNSSSPPGGASRPNSQSRVFVSRTVISEGPSRVTSPQSPTFTQLAAEDKSDRESRVEDVPPNKKQKTASARKADQDNEKKPKRLGAARKRRN
ncbi:hypothetical protein PM082_004618 [Marasmius tenuissimus]|nr:hypothetical protein PM082_004618 [Marasmius tenuissimus]